MTYKIISFNEITGSIQFEIPDYAPFNVDLPIEDGKFIEGEKLDQYIKNFIPAWHIERTNLLKNGIENVENIRRLVETPSPISRSIEEFSTDARIQRDLLLMQSDWVMLSDSPLSDTLKQLFIEYRQALRDVPQQEGFPVNIEWPAHPLL